MEFLTLHRSVEVARACRFSITRVLGCRGVGPLARGSRRSAALGTARRARRGALPPRSARSALPAGGVAGDRDPGGRSRDARLCRVCDLGEHGAGGCVEPVGNPVPSTEREDVPIGPSAAGSRGSGSPAVARTSPRGRSAGHPVRVARGGPGREDIARRAALPPPIWCRCSPTTPGWCSASSPSPRSPTKFLVCESF